LRIAAVSRTAEGVAVEQGLCRPGDAQLVPNPIDPEDVVAKRRENKPSVVIGLLGGATYRKGFDLLPEAVQGMKNRNVTWRLHVSNVVQNGDQPIWDELERHGAIVQNVGKVVDVRCAYAEMDIVFCPSRNESFCRVAAEAMLNGLPVVASDIEPLRELLGEDEAGILFEVGNTEDAVSALRRLVDDDALRDEMGRAGQQRATIYRPEDVARQMLKLYGIS
jgi:glycosyltransferase involved in cell wall biosynthesis